MSIVLQSTGGGQITIQEPATASNFTQTLPAATGTVMVSGNQPAFSAYRSSAQTIATNTSTKVQFNSETFDTANCFDSTTNYRFTPTVAGYYYISACCTISFTTGGSPYVSGYIYKNGSAYARNANSQPSNNNYLSGSVNALVYMNGTTDYVEFYLEQASTGNASVITGADWTWFCGSLMRTA